MAIFLEVEQLVNLFFQELPPGMFADDRADNVDDKSKNSVSSSDIRAQCVVVDAAYQNMSQIYANKFASLTEIVGLGLWEKDWFPRPVDVTQTIDQRRANLISKIRSNGGISMPAIRKILDPVFAEAGLEYVLAPWSGANGAIGAWVLGVSPLGYSTFLSFLDPLIGAGPPHPLDCSLDYAAAGLSHDQLVMIQETAYRYDVQIFGNASNALIANVDDLLTQYEPARSDHNIINNYPGPAPL